MITCLLKSCSAECLNKVRNSSDNHVVTSNSGETSKDGFLFLCILISRVVINNRSTLSYYSHQLTCLDQLMVKVNNDITAFNNEVQSIMNQLQSHGESIQHLMVNLFKGYEAATDKEFVSYIHLKKYENNEGGSIDAEKLMYHAENLYTEMVRATEWTNPPKVNQEILALTVETKLLKEQYLSGEVDNLSRNSERKRMEEGCPQEKKSLRL